MGFSSRRSRWRLSVMRRDRQWGRCLATAPNAFVRASTRHDADPARLGRRRPCGSRRTRRRSARGPEGQPEAPGVGPRRPRWSGPDPMVVWNGSRPSRAAGAAPDTPRPPSGRNAAGARPGGLDDFGLPRRTRRLGRDGVDDERSPLLRWLENYLRADVRAQRASPHPLNLPVPVATRSYGRRVFACASPSSMRTSKSLGSLHSSAFSRRCRAMSTARMIKLARARASDVAYPNTCFTCTRDNLGLGRLVCREQTIKKSSFRPKLLRVGPRGPTTAKSPQGPIDVPLASSCCENSVRSRRVRGGVLVCAGPDELAAEAARARNGLVDTCQGKGHQNEHRIQSGKMG